MPILLVRNPKNTDRINLPKLAAFTGSCFDSSLQKVFVLFLKERNKIRLLFLDYVKKIEKKLLTLPNWVGFFDRLFYSRQVIFDRHSLDWQGTIFLHEFYRTNNTILSAYIQLVNVYFKTSEVLFDRRVLTDWDLFYTNHAYRWHRLSWSF